MMTFDQAYSQKLFTFDMAGEVDRLCAQLRSLLVQPLKRRGLVVGISGGIDSSVCLALAAKALGPEKVMALQMPELHSAEETLGISGRLAEHFGVAAIHEDITPILQSVHFYERYDQAVQQVIPEYSQGWKSKITIPDVAENQGFTYFNIIAESPLGQVVKNRRIRKMMEYYYADRMHYAVIGTPNRLEYDQGFFVKLGDGAADIKPIAHLYKTQVYMLAHFLDVPTEIQNRRPTTDTYSLPQGQDEFYFSLPYERMDIWYKQWITACRGGTRSRADPGTGGARLQRYRNKKKDNQIPTTCTAAYRQRS
jgi:NAD+ synthase